MEIKLNETEILKISKIAGTIAGIADSLSRDFLAAPTDNRKKSLYAGSAELMEILYSKVDLNKPLSKEAADKAFKYSK